MKRSSKKGFTLTEILIVIIIISIILTIAIPSIIAIRRRINERLYETKKSQILVAAEMYGKDKGITLDTVISVYTLLNDDYITADVDANNKTCKNSDAKNKVKGCITSPVDDEVLNDVPILLKPSGSSIIAIWNGNDATTTSVELVNAIKEKLDCSQLSETNPCLFGKDEKDPTSKTNPNNYLYNNGIMWRILGIYKIDGYEVAKMITDDTVVWEIDA